MLTGNVAAGSAALAAMKSKSSSNAESSLNWGAVLDAGVDILPKASSKALKPAAGVEAGVTKNKCG